MSKKGALDELIKDLEDFAKSSKLIKDFLNKQEQEWEDFKKKYCSSQQKCMVENKIKKEMLEYLKCRGYGVSPEVKLNKNFFERKTKVDLEVNLNETKAFIELKLNKKDKNWGYEEFIALKEKVDCVETKAFLILFIVDAKIRRKLTNEEKDLLKKAENLEIRILRVYLDDNSKVVIEEVK